MLFNSISFALFFVGFFCVYHFCVRSQGPRLWLVSIGSVLFYGAWDYRFIPLLLGTALLDFYIALEIDRDRDRSDRAGRRKRFLILSIVLNLSVLGFFKYANFFLGSTFGLLHLVGLDWSTPILRITLPIGISFYTFQSMSYTIDVYRRQLRARERAIEFVAAVTFFPHLVAGPIIRASTLLPQFENPTPPTWLDAKRGFLLVAIGLFNKNVADLLAPTVAGVFDAHGALDALQAWTGALAFAAQIYGDFAGYSAIAIGIALLLGFKIPLNFKLPYLATSVREFWQRWHISLSSWLGDYLFLPLFRKYPRRPYLTIIVMMTLAGLWHGANWTFVVYGVFHGVLIAATDIVTERSPEFLDRVPDRVLRWFQRALTFYLVMIGFVIFRAQSFGRAGELLAAMHWPSKASELGVPALFVLALVLVALVIGHLVSTFEVAEDRAPILGRPYVLWPLIVGCVSFAIAFGGPGEAFIYFQF